MVLVACDLIRSVFRRDEKEKKAAMRGKLHRQSTSAERGRGCFASPSSRDKRLDEELPTFCLIETVVLVACDLIRSVFRRDEKEKKAAMRGKLHRQSTSAERGRGCFASPSSRDKRLDEELPAFYLIETVVLVACDLIRSVFRRDEKEKKAAMRGKLHRQSTSAERTRLLCLSFE